MKQAQAIPETFLGRRGAADDPLPIPPKQGREPALLPFCSRPGVDKTKGPLITVTFSNICFAAPRRAL
jgi:hypothetical protein